MAYQVKPEKGVLPPYGMAPAGGIGDRPPMIEPDFAALFGDGGPDGMPFPPPSAAGENKTFIDIIDGRLTRKEADAALSGEPGAASADHIGFSTSEPALGGFYISGASKYGFSNSTFRADGNGKNDFAGNGAVIMTDGDSEVTVTDCDIRTNGCIRPCTVAAGNSLLTVRGATLICNGGTLPEDYAPVIGPGMMEPPSGLEIGGNCRTHLSMGNSRSYFYDSSIIADGWAALSTDACIDSLYLEANNCDVVCRNSGYGFYSDGGCNVVLNGCRVTTATHTGIMAGQCTARLDGCTVKSGGYGVMLHSVMGMTCEIGELSIKGGSLETEDAVVFIKSQNVYLDIDGAELKSAGGLLIRTVMNPDAHATKVGEDEAVYGVKVALSNTALEGDIVHENLQRTMAVSLYNTKLKGAVKGAYLSLDEKSRWTATADSEVGFVGDTDILRVDALPGVRIAAVAGAGCSLYGQYKLPSGGTLEVR